MTPNKLRNLVAAYLKQPAEAFVQNEVDLILEALNSVRKDLELEQDWEMSKGQVDVQVDPVTGYTFDPAVANVKTIRDAFIVGENGSLRPIRIYNADSLAQKSREEGESDEFDSELRYPSDEGSSSRCVQGIYQVGNSIFLHPKGGEDATSPTIRLVFYRWMPDYTGEEEEGDEDFFCLHGKSCLQWGAIVECNFFAKEFVGRQEGNLASPENKFEAAKARLVAWNDFILETGRVPVLR